MLRIGTDIGGTFTDIVVIDEKSSVVRHTKVLTSTAQPADAIVVSLDEAGVELAHVSLFSHATTIAINAIIQRSGARTGIVTTKGFRDTLELRRGARTHILDPLMDKPMSFVPRRWRQEIDERVLASGQVLRPLDPDELCRVVEQLVDDGVEAIAVCLLHSHLYPHHERQAGAVLAERFPEISYTLSSDVVPEIKEFERTSTAVLNAYCQPVVKKYLDALDLEVRSRGLTTDIHLMQSNGGLMTAHEAAISPIRILESGPASGAISAAKLGARIGVTDLITFDMGGTTAKSAVVEGASPLMTVEYELFEEHDKPGSGWPIRVPMVDIVEIGAGGGSIAWVDESGRLLVGPRSAGSEPGPACYLRGGSDPTITDAHVVLGNLESLLGGEFALDATASQRTIQERIAQPLGLGVEEAAAGILQIASAKVADLIREVTVARGLDPRNFSLVAYGGAGPLEAATILDELDIPLAIIPPTPGTFSAFGLLEADLVTYTARTFLRPVASVEPHELKECYDVMTEELSDVLKRQNVQTDFITLSYFAELRYRGQFHQISLPLPEEQFNSHSLAHLASAFHDEHNRLFTYQTPDESVEFVNLRARATGAVDRHRRQSLPLGHSRAGLKRHRLVRFPKSTMAIDTDVYDRDKLGASAIVVGPSIIEEYTSVTLIPPGFTAEIDDQANIHLQRKR